VYIQIRINAKLQTGMRGQKADLTGISPLRRQRCALDCSAIEEEEEEEITDEGQMAAPQHEGTLLVVMALAKILL
jgi:hypothetical protein